MIENGDAMELRLKLNISPCGTFCDVENRYGYYLITSQTVKEIVIDKDGIYLVDENDYRFNNNNAFSSVDEAKKYIKNLGEHYEIEE